MLTIKEILTDKIVLDIECVDRVYLNGYVKYLQICLLPISRICTFFNKIPGIGNIT